MKKIVLFIAIIVLISAIFFSTGEEKYEAEEDFSTSENQIKNIVVNADNVDINISTAEINEIQIKRKTNMQKFHEVEYFASYTNHELTIGQYNKKGNQKKSNARDQVEIIIPSESKLKNITINSQNSQIQMMNLTAENVVLEVEERLNVNMDKSKINNMQIKTKNINSEIKNSQINNLLSYEVTSGTILEENLSGKKNKVLSTGKTSYTSDQSFFLESEISQNSKLKIFYIISAEKNYKFINANMVKEEDEKKEKIDEMNYGKVITKEKSVINLNDNDIKKLSYAENVVNEENDEIILQ